MNFISGEYFTVIILTADNIFYIILSMFINLHLRISVTISYNNVKDTMLKVNSKHTVKMKNNERKGHIRTIIKTPLNSCFDCTYDRAVV